MKKTPYFYSTIAIIASLQSLAWGDPAYTQPPVQYVADVSEAVSDAGSDVSNIVGTLAGDVGMMGQQLGQIVSELNKIEGTINQELGDNLKQLVTYTVNMGRYFGFDITKYCTPEGQCQNAPVSSQLLDIKESFQTEFNLIATTLGALLPVHDSGYNQSPVDIVPKDTEVAQNYLWAFQKYGNQAFQNYNINNTNKLSVSPLIDQQPYQPDPVSQSILNILGTPNDSYCYDQKTGTLPGKCTLVGGGGPALSRGQVAMNVIGAFPLKDSYPAIGNFSSPTDNASLVNQLNSDSLLGPLLFDNSGQNQSGQIPQTTAGGRGLTANNQLQAASNFIRYATGGVTPVPLAGLNDYSELYIKAGNLSGKVSPAEQTQAQIKLANYLAGLRIYAAQTSVGISNLYAILSKRMPLDINQGNGNGVKTSQALSEYLMATRRLQIPQGSKQKPWFNQINEASPATVQKEIAVLLAEINYQLYLTRAQQERLLLTNTMMLLQLSGAKQPNAHINEMTPQSDSTGLFALPQASNQ